MRVRQFPVRYFNDRPIVTVAYVKYVPHMDRPPGPMLDTDEQRIMSDEAFVATITEFTSGVIIRLKPRITHSTTISRSILGVQGLRISGRLIDFAEAEARVGDFRKSGFLPMSRWMRMSPTTNRWAGKKLITANRMAMRTFSCAALRLVRHLHEHAIDVTVLCAIHTHRASDGPASCRRSQFP